MSVSEEFNKRAHQDLISGLPEELATECLVRVPFEFHSSIKSVSRLWRNLISDGCFNRERRRAGKDESLLCLVQPLTSPSSPVNSSVDGDVNDKKKEEEGESHSQQNQQLQQPRVIGTPLYGLSVYNATLDTWHCVAIPERIPLFCECVSLQDSKQLLLIGGWDPETLQPVKDVFILDFSSGDGRGWKRGKPMSSARSFFACAEAGVGSKQVYVAGGHDDQKNAIKSAEVYDVEKDEWVMIPPMREGRDECVGFSIGVGFCVLSGYGTDSQGQFRSDAEVYDPDTDSWALVEDVWPFPDLSPRGRTSAAVGSKLWCFVDSERECEARWEVEDGEGKWKVVMETVRLPVTTMTSVFAGSLSGQAVAMVGGGGEESGTMMVRTDGGKWSHVSTPSGFSSLPFSYASIYV
ncbi:unnamed protein product [Eruca vesicaria subsp. sativa]|uniref:F-box domain-containing protein n=1 Tax=Eruca vesicaria subsp. sativa TaxID=29727 RepID=A0ABC8J871_ERUVS|nr:unnamed protein product [Eruca vesicaria subsp. sativa]